MGTDGAREFVRGMIGRGMGTTDSYQGEKMNWERVRPARGGWRPAKHIFKPLNVLSIPTPGQRGCWIVFGRLQFECNRWKLVWRLHFATFVFIE